MPNKKWGVAKVKGSEPERGIKDEQVNGAGTSKGKSRSSRNAARHWIEAGRILPDERQDAAVLDCGFEEDFKPQGLMEEEVIDDLVFNRLIKRRIDIAFTREFSKASIETTIKEIELRERSVIQYRLRIAQLSNHYPIEGGGAERLSPSACISALRGLQGRIRDRGVQPQDLEMIRAAYGDQPTENAAVAMYQLLAVAVKKKIEQDEAVETKEDPGSKKEILETLKTEIQQQELREDLAQRMMAIEGASDIQEPRGPIAPH